jgi:hypothetical protein
MTASTCDLVGVQPTESVAIYIVTWKDRPPQWVGNGGSIGGTFQTVCTCEELPGKSDRCCENS